MSTSDSYTHSSHYTATRGLFYLVIIIINYNLLLGICQFLLYILPIDDTEDALQVVGSDVLILKVVRVFPDIDAEERNQTGSGLERVLVGS